MPRSASSVIPLYIDSHGLAALPLRSFAASFQQVLPGLLRFMRSDALRQHPKWGRLVPFHVEPYGNAPSIGHICRPDIVLTDQGPRITEIDFVPSGRGWTLLGIPSANGQLANLATYRSWYNAMGYGGASTPVYYATGSTTVCKEEADLFAAAMQRTGVNVLSVNVDVDRMTPPGLIDRLFYRAELARNLRPEPHRIITAEPWFDSKMIFAVVHDTTLTNALTQYVGQRGLAFLRQVLIPTYSLEDVVRQRGSALERVINDRANFVLKSTEVEEPWSWGARSVVLGSRMTRTAWESAVRFAAGNPPRKELGQHPIVQPFCTSVNFREIWDGVVDGSLTTPDPARLGKDSDKTTHAPARRHVYARVGLYFLVANGSGQVFTPPQGVLTLRQDPLAHGASDAIITAFAVA